MTLKLDQAVCLSLAGGFAIVAPPSFPRNRAPNLPRQNEPEQDAPRADRAATDAAGDDDAPNRRARNRSRKTS